MSKNEQINAECQQKWNDAVQALGAFHTQYAELLKHCPSALLYLVAAGLKQPGERHFAIRVASEHFSEEQLKELFPALLIQSSHYHPHTAEVQKLLLRIPKEWLASRIEAEAEPILAEAQDEGYWCLFTIYKEIDRQLAERLTRRALRSANPHTQDAGRQFCEVLGIHPATNPET